ncbi:MAG: four helix bundle protein [Flavobacteriales bacterium]|nr:four helix bundle protein [Flavobacteriales bacterium]
MGNARTDDLVALCEGASLTESGVAHDPAATYSNSALYRENAILRQSFEFAVAILKYTDGLSEQRRWLLNQIQRSGCSIGANVKEAQNAESLKDFIHKMKIALKEADETEYWYHLLAATKDRATDPSLIERLQSILRILNKIISTAKKRSETIR